MLNLEAQLSVLKKPDGSCEISNGKTKILCGINGPGDIQSSKRKFDRMNIIFSINRLVKNKKMETISSVNNQQKCDYSSSFIESIVKNAVDIFAYPRTALQICAQELKVNNITDSTLINGLCLALLDSGIRMNYVCCALSVVKLTNGNLIFEPTELQLQDVQATFIFVFKSSLSVENINNSVLIASNCQGIFSVEDFINAKKLAHTECSSVFNFYKQKIFEKFAHCIVK